MGNPYRKATTLCRDEQAKLALIKIRLYTS